MNSFKRVLNVTILVLTIFLYVGMLDAALCQNSYELSKSGGGNWAYRADIIATESAGLKRVGEPIEIMFVSDKVKAQGEDIRITDKNHIEVPCQVSVIGINAYKIWFFAQVSPNSSSNYYLYFGNPNAGKPDYGSAKSSLDNLARLWRTDDILIQWGGKAGFNLQTTEPITVLKFDSDGIGDPSTGTDCITDDKGNWSYNYAYGYLGSNISGPNPLGFGSSSGSITANGPIFSELQLGSARIRSYKGNKNWIVTNGVADGLLMYGRWYDREKHGGFAEKVIKDNGEGDVGPLVTYYSSTQTNPGYMCFRRSDNGLVFGAVGVSAASWYISAKESGAYDRTIAFDNSANKSDAKIYWYSDTSNGYEGIEQFSKQVLNPLKVEVIMDTEPPVTSMSASPMAPDGQNGWYVTQPQVTFSINEEGTTRYRLDDGDVIAYSEPITIPDGEHRLSYYSIDTHGNTEDEKVVDIKVDTSPPDVPSLLDPVDGLLLNNSMPILYWSSSTDTGSGLSHYDLYVDGSLAVSNVGSNTNNAILYELADGLHSWSVRAYDRAGNCADSAVFRFFMDTTPPATRASMDPAIPDGRDGWYVTLPSVEFSSDETSTIYYRIDSGTYMSYESTVTVSEGVHELYYYSVDLAGNEEQEKFMRLKIDCSSPQIEASISSRSPDNSYLVNEPIAFTYCATDSVSGIESVTATVNGIPIQSGDELSFGEAGEYVLSISARDIAGNEISMMETFAVGNGYSFKWLPPIRKDGDTENQSYLANWRSTVPIKFSIFNSLGKFVGDESVKVVVSDGVNSAIFTYGEGSGNVKIIPCDEQYLLNLSLKSYPWLKPGGNYTVSAYFGGDDRRLGTLYGEIGLELR